MRRSKTVFLVEDNRLYQMLFIQVLKEIKHAILYGVANNGKEALEKLKNSEILPDLIVSDINMPIMDGMQCFTEIKKNPKIKDIPVAFLSSSTSQKELVRKLGAKAFLKKSSDVKTLREQLEQMINADFSSKNQITG